MMIIELLKWFLIIWLTLSFIKIVLVWGQLLDFAQCYAEVFKITYSGKLIWDLALSTPVIIVMTTPFLFFAEGWKFFFIYTRQEIFEYLTDIRNEMYNKM